ncbi:hypothetical protein I7I51_04965 [Histoplasma capsulatum]|uniref:Uncharacterized protein n=1 Tax=Ajellomyces capsulatus TaxID=5037 RepID=A0A8A1M129_AJECA|nr:hypothetical protein I7I51_04965 [Histoplasma capsulatum]
MAQDASTSHKRRDLPSVQQLSGPADQGAISSSTRSKSHSQSNNAERARKLLQGETQCEEEEFCIVLRRFGEELLYLKIASFLGENCGMWLAVGRDDGMDIHSLKTPCGC